MPAPQVPERNLGAQPIDGIMLERELDNHAVVAASTEQITHKMVVRARNGRRLTRRVQLKIRNALNKAANSEYSLDQLFNY